MRAGQRTREFAVANRCQVSGVGCQVLGERRCQVRGARWAGEPEGGGNRCGNARCGDVARACRRDPRQAGARASGTKRNGSSGRTRTYNPSADSRHLYWQRARRLACGVSRTTSQPAPTMNFGPACR